jgi:hypothetical protein
MIGGGLKEFEDSKLVVETAIKEYDEAIFDITASMVASPSLAISLANGSRSQIRGRYDAKARSR